MSTFKRLIICCDGTWQQSDGPRSNPASNVTKLCRAISRCEKLHNGSEIQQITFYQSGVGNHALTMLSSHIEAAFGIGLAEKVLEAYSFLVNNYDDEGDQPDEIFLFGFSRGAFTVRCLAGLVDCIGILPKVEMHQFPDLYARYMDQEADQLKQESHGSPVRIKVIGVWDTVGALGVPEFVDDMLPMLDLNKKHRFHRPMLSGNIDNAFQALALDERRATFCPSLWYLDANVQHPPPDNLIQCWFPGRHIDVGGGSIHQLRGNSPPGGNTQLSDISLFWMLDLIQPFLQLDSKYLDGLVEQHWAYVKQLPSIELRKRDKFKNVLAHGHRRPELPCGWAVGPVHDSLGVGPRTPGQFYPSKESGSTRTETRELMHPSVRVRRDVLQDRWQPVAMDGFHMRPGPKVGRGWAWNKLYRGGEIGALRSSWEWVRETKDGRKVVIPEYRLIGQWETKLAMGCPMMHCGAVDDPWSIIEHEA